MRLFTQALGTALVAACLSVAPARAASTYDIPVIASLTGGTPVLFSSVAHGSALDIAGQGEASHAAIVEAVERLVGSAHAKAA